MTIASQPFEERRETTATTSRWSVIAAYATLCAATQVLWVTYAPVAADAAKHFGVTVGTVGWLAQVFPLAYVLLAIPAGALLDRWFRGGLLVGVFLTAAGGLIRLVADDFTWALIGQGLAAVAQPFVLNAVTGLTVGYLAERHRANGIAIASGATFAGIVTGFLVGASLPGAGEIRTITAITAVIGVAAATFMAVVLRHKPRQTASPSLGFAALRVAWGDPYLRRICAIAFVPFGTFVALSTFAQPLLEPAGVKESTAGLMLIMNVVAGVVGCAVIPTWADRRHRESAALGLGVVVAAVGCAVLAVAPSVVSGFVVLAAVGLALLPTLPIALTLTEKRAGQAESTAAGLVWMAGNLGGLVVASIIGVMVGAPRLAFVTLAVITAAGVPVVVWFRRLADRDA